MSSFMDRARTQAQRGLRQGREKIEEVQTQRTGNDLLRRLGAAYYRKERGSGTEQEVRSALTALEAHITQHGDAFLK
ncbi:hypothetical protein [Streptomyces sp. YIM 98790]|uniref:hypothetical protein n=1 Tax=Streptomyces sp. YIM 98790 TaxID=2689077 RepID=UPI0014098B59|nr:hypothetical protein [Streptomyces sp. YIM 98790]